MRTNDDKERISARGENPHGCDAVTIRCAHGDTVLYPLAVLELEVDGISIPVEAAASESLPEPVLLGRDWLVSLKPVGAELQSEEVMVAVTQAGQKAVGGGNSETVAGDN